MSNVLTFPRATVVLNGGDIAEQLRPLLEAAVETVAGKIEAECRRLEVELGAQASPGHRRVTVRIEISDLLMAVVRSHENYAIRFEDA